MHQPRPYGLHAIGLPLTERDEAFVASVTKRITNLKEISGVDSMKMVYDLPDGGYVIIQDTGGNFRVISHKPLPQESIVFNGVATDHIPMLYSGAVTNAVLYPNEGLGLRVTEQTRLRLNNYDKNTILPDKDLELQRFRIDYADQFQVFKPRLPTVVLRTQYMKLRPTWYSGAMSEVMQIVGGYGRQDFSELPDDEIERAQIVLPADVLLKINEQLANIRLPGFTGMPNRDGQFLYDYSFSKTNAIAFDTNKKPWLIQVSASGVYAMPMPIIPATATPAFRQYMEQVKDNEILAILDRFGAMPSGETFPSKEGFQAWLRAGVIIKICDASDFYSNIAYSSACGWSFNTKGTEGYNTCYNYKDEAGIGYGMTYKIRLELLPSKIHDGAGVVDIENSDPRFLEITKYLSALMPNIQAGSDEHRAILYKLRVTPLSDIYDRSKNNYGSDDVNYWNNKELEPMAAHTGRVTKVYEGYLYHPSPFDFQPQIKFPEPLLDGCISHDFLPINRQIAQSEYPNSDTIMFAYYIGDSLKVVKYFVDWSSFKQETTGNFEKYMRVGTWESESYSGSSSIQGYFYSSDIDDREVIAPTIINTKIVGKDLGWDSKPFFEFDGFLMMCGTLYRRRYYTHDKTIDTSGDRVLSLAVCIPYLCRNAIISAKKDYTTSGTRVNTFDLYWVSDPNKYRFWTYDPVFANMNMTIKNPKGSPYPANGNPVWVEEYSYNPHPEFDFADNGDWVGGLPSDYTWLIHPDNNVWSYGGGGAQPKVTNTRTETDLSRKEVGSISFSMNIAQGVVNKKIPENWYYSGSPTLMRNVFYKDACAIVFGESSYCNVSEPNEKSERAVWGYSKVADNRSAHHFIGVINE